MTQKKSYFFVFLQHMTARFGYNHEIVPQTYKTKNRPDLNVTPSRDGLCCITLSWYTLRLHHVRAMVSRRTKEC